MKNSRTLKLIALALICMMVLGACTAEQPEPPAAQPAPADTAPAPVEADPEPVEGEAILQVGVVLQTLDSDYWRLVRAGALAMGEHLGVHVSVVAPHANHDITGQIAMVEDMIVRRLDAIVLSRNDADALVPVCLQARAAGIPVVTVDGDINDPDARNVFVGTENYAAAQLAGHFMLEAIPEGSDIAIIRGLPGVLTHDHRQDGFQGIVEAGGLNVVSVQSANSDRALGVSAAENILLSFPHIRGIFATNDAMALGALEAVRAMGLMDQITVIGFDGSPDAIDSIIAGELTASVAQLPIAMGAAAVEAAVNILRGQTAPDRLSIDALVLTGANALDYLDDLHVALETFS